MSIMHHTGRRVLLMTAMGGVLGCDGAPAAPHSSATRAAAAAQGSTPASFAMAQGGPRVRFADLAIFFEFNSTDNDLGAQIFLDAEAWNRITAANPSGQNILDFKADNQFGTLGITELRFESAEPSPAIVLDLFDPGDYEFLGQTVDGKVLAGTATLSHALPPAAVFTPAGGDEVDAANTVISWNSIPGLAGYEIIVENERSGRSISVELGPSATSLHVPAEFMEPKSDYKVEVLTIATNGNKTIVEHTFTTSR